jgi:hypothetical protein
LTWYDIISPLPLIIDAAKMPPAIIFAIDVFDDAD